MFTKRNPDGTWSKAQPLPGPVNTSFATESPYIHFDNQTLYFTSNGHPGFGGKDIFYSKIQPDGTWGEPVNLGYPINTPANEFSLVVDPDGKTAYFASNREKGGEDLDIFSFILPEQNRANKIAWILGNVFDESTGKPLKVQVEFYNLNDQKEFQQVKSDQNGSFFAVMPVNKSFAVFINQAGYLPYSENYDLAGVDTELNYEITIRLKPIKQGTKFTLNNVLFDTDSYNLKPESEEELNRLTAFLKNNPDIKAELHGHTDNQGTPAYNQKLSEQRAKAVVEYLVAHGIQANRLSSKGFGDQQPIADNNTEKGRKQNRRTDVILK
jgi:outer membrane protein OmpA-like peptidoglycan-associated protein